MAYRQVVLGDKVKITDCGRAHGCLGTVLYGGYWGGVRVMYTYGGKDVIGEFKQDDLVLARDTPTKVTINTQKPKQNTTLTKENQMSTFKIGDKVKVIRINQRCGFFSSKLGKTGTVLLNDHSELPLGVKFEDGSVDWGCYDEVELVQPELKTPELKTLAEKLDALDKLTSEIRAMVGLTPSGSAL